MASRLKSVSPTAQNSGFYLLVVLSVVTLTKSQSTINFLTNSIPTQSKNNIETRLESMEKMMKDVSVILEQLQRSVHTLQQVENLLVLLLQEILLTASDDGLATQNNMDKGNQDDDTILSSSVESAEIGDIQEERKEQHQSKLQTMTQWLLNPLYSSHIETTGIGFLLKDLLQKSMLLKNDMIGISSQPLANSFKFVHVNVPPSKSVNPVQTSVESASPQSYSLFPPLQPMMLINDDDEEEKELNEASTTTSQGIPSDLNLFKDNETLNHQSSDGNVSTIKQQSLPGGGHMLTESIRSHHVNKSTFDVPLLNIVTTNTTLLPASRKPSPHGESPNDNPDSTLQVKQNGTMDHSDLNPVADNNDERFPRSQADNFNRKQITDKGYFQAKDILAFHVNKFTSKAQVRTEFPLDQFNRDTSEDKHSPNKDIRLDHTLNPSSHESDSRNRETQEKGDFKGSRTSVKQNIPLRSSSDDADKQRNKLLNSAEIREVDDNNNSESDDNATEMTGKRADGLPSITRSYNQDQTQDITAITTVNDGNKEYEDYVASEKLNEQRGKTNKSYNNNNQDDDDNKTQVNINKYKTFNHTDVKNADDNKVADQMSEPLIHNPKVFHYTGDILGEYQPEYIHFSNHPSTAAHHEIISEEQNNNSSENEFKFLTTTEKSLQSFKHTNEHSEPKLVQLENTWSDPNHEKEISLTDALVQTLELPTPQNSEEKAKISFKDTLAQVLEPPVISKRKRRQTFDDVLFYMLSDLNPVKGQSYNPALSAEMIELLQRWRQQQQHQSQETTTINTNSTRRGNKDNIITTMKESHMTANLTTDVQMFTTVTAGRLGTQRETKSGNRSANDFYMSTLQPDVKSTFNAKRFINNKEKNMDSTNKDNGGNNNGQKTNDNNGGGEDETQVNRSAKSWAAWNLITSANTRNHDRISQGDNIKSKRKNVTEDARDINYDDDDDLDNNAEDDKKQTLTTGESDIIDRYPEHADDNNSANYDTNSQESTEASVNQRITPFLHIFETSSLQKGLRTYQIINPRINRQKRSFPAKNFQLLSSSSNKGKNIQSASNGITGSNVISRQAQQNQQTSMEEAQATNNRNTIPNSGKTPNIFKTFLESLFGPQSQNGEEAENEEVEAEETPTVSTTPQATTNQNEALQHSLIGFWRFLIELGREQLLLPTPSIVANNITTTAASPVQPASGAPMSPASPSAPNYLPSGSQSTT